MVLLSNELQLHLGGGVSNIAALPMSLLERFTGKDVQSQLVLCLQFLAPLSRPDVITLNDGR
jgi:hypothetical protein